MQSFVYNCWDFNVTCKPKNAYFCQKFWALPSREEPDIKLFIVIAKFVGEQSCIPVHHYINTYVFMQIEFPASHLDYPLFSILGCTVEIHVIKHFYICCILAFCNLIFFLCNVGNSCLLYFYPFSSPFALTVVNASCRHWLMPIGLVFLGWLFNWMTLQL